ncbi:hypothetical protein COV49_00320 [Candidatus Falkowbacteria bacterium CG11_big_fil_rev_8_21_14_0_20_39_10]|uniref:Penicillin-binding protein transpeptidase domain-containing protein n=1 Tax=Candidatus Falkowbacteria bacterium CG11_big_fil_rev_8_21_14_0_20_39_10 TaxID=1974570 RepID=A0A2M6KAA3_9BACT|nr:MAG: hypothetical protein COV49_00320 [Candidatus Falkowbacteria bacterium CG11_big_fil_rev_8_21_14_0_20_39_10]
MESLIRLITNCKLQISNMIRRIGKKKKIIQNNNRINIIIAIVFLFGGLILYALYDLQVAKYDLYTALAVSQHQVYSQLEPERGKIYMQDKNGQLYPYATNKEFASVFAVPKDIADSQATAEKLYLVFNEDKVKEEVEELLADQAKEELKKELYFVASLGLSQEEMAAKQAEVNARHEARQYDKSYLAQLEIKREAEVKLRKEKIIDDYLKILTKKDDPYEPIENKVDEETLKELYALLASRENYIVSKEDLELKQGEILFKSDGQKLTIFGISHTMFAYRFYPESELGSHTLGFVSLSQDEQRGRYGLEGFFDEELSGQFGSVKSERGADRNVIIVNDREYISPVDGDNLILTLDRSIQFAVCQKLNEIALRHGADGGTVIAVNPRTGAILAICSWPDYDPNNYKEVEDIKVYNNPAIFDEYEPGSVFKPITMAAGLDQEKITPQTTYNDEGQVMVKGWPKPIKNSDYDTHGGYGRVDMNNVLENSLNTGAIFAMQQIGPEVFSQYVKNFGFGEKTGIELETENSGNIRNLQSDNIQEVYAATASFGQGLTVTPLQMLMSYAAIANGGILMKPYIVKEIIHADGSKEITQSRQVRRVISEKAATLLSGMLANVVEGGHAIRAAVSGYYIGGKTGTAQVASGSVRGYGGQTIHTFVGIAPIDDPAFVMLVKLNDPKDVQFAASSAAPLFGELAGYLLDYLEVPKGR